MRRRGLTQQALGTAVGMSQRGVSKWLAGDSNPGAAVMVRLANLFEVPVATLADDQADLPPDPIDLRFAEAKAAAASLADQTPRVREDIFNSHLEKSGHAAFLRRVATELRQQAAEQAQLLEDAADACDPLLKPDWLEKAEKHPDANPVIRRAVDAECQRRSSAKVKAGPLPPAVAAALEEKRRIDQEEDARRNPEPPEGGRHRATEH